MKRCIAARSRREGEEQGTKTHRLIWMARESSRPGCWQPHPSYIEYGSTHISLRILYPSHPRKDIYDYYDDDAGKSWYTTRPRPHIIQQYRTMALPYRSVPVHPFSSWESQQELNSVNTSDEEVTDQRSISVMKPSIQPHACRMAVYCCILLLCRRSSTKKTEFCIAMEWRNGAMHHTSKYHI